MLKMMNSMIKSNMQSMQQSLQSPTTTMPSKNALQSSSASIEFQTRNDNDGDNEISSVDK